jgi:hypothetical protein
VVTDDGDAAAELGAPTPPAVGGWAGGGATPEPGAAPVAEAATPAGPPPPLVNPWNASEVVGAIEAQESGSQQEELGPNADRGAGASAVPVPPPEGQYRKTTGGGRVIQEKAKPAQPEAERFGDRHPGAGVEETPPGKPLQTAVRAAPRRAAPARACPQAQAPASATAAPQPRRDLGGGRRRGWWAGRRASLRRLWRDWRGWEDL